MTTFIIKCMRLGKKRGEEGREGDRGRDGRRGYGGREEVGEGRIGG